MPQVKDILRDRNLFCVEETETVAEVTKQMAELRVGAILVLNAGELKGIFSERDLMTRVVVQQRDPARTLVRDVMTTNLATVDESATLESAMESMQSHNCRHLPVLRETRPVGFISMRDLMNVELARKTEELHHMRAYIHGST